MFPWSYDPFAEDEETTGFGPAAPPTKDGGKLIGVKTPLGYARPRWTDSYSLWLDGDDFSLPVNRFDHRTLEPIYGKARPFETSTPNSIGHSQPTPSPAGVLPFEEVRTELGVAKPSLGRDGPLSLEIDGRKRPLHHFDSSRVTPVGPGPIASPVASPVGPASPTTPGSPSTTLPLTSAQVGAALSGATAASGWQKFQTDHGLKYSLPSQTIQNGYGSLGETVVRPRIIRNFTDTQWAMGMHDGGGIDPHQYDQVMDSALPDHIDFLLGLGDVGTVAVLKEAGEHGPLAHAYRNSDPNARGHDPGQPYLKKPGLYDPGDPHNPHDPRPRNVYLAVDRPYSKGPIQGVQGSVEMNFHERLHALDDILGNLHNTSDFVAAWVADNASFDDGTGYYKLKGDGGRHVELDHALSDTFAESGAMYYKDPEELKNRSRNLYEYWKNLDETLQSGALPYRSYDPSGLRHGASRPTG